MIRRSRRIGPPRASILTRLSGALAIGAAVFIAARLAEPAKPVALPAPAPITIDTPVRPIGPLPRDGGGWIHEYRDKVWLANIRGERVEIRGTCISACTMWLGAKNLCVAPEAMFWFHAARDPIVGWPDPGGSALMMSMYPRAVSLWAQQEGALRRVEFSVRHMLTGEDLIAMGVPKCD